MRDGVTQYAIEPGLKDFAASARLTRLQKASQLLEELRRVVTALEPANKNAVIGHITAIADLLKSPRQIDDAPPPQSTLGSTLADVIARRETR
jgi:hypothetical protein